MIVYLKDIKPKPKNEHEAIVLNTIDSYEENSRQSIFQTVIGTYENEACISSAPSCSCAENPLSGYNNLDRICSVCGSKVVEKDIYESSVWLCKPTHISSLITVRCLFLLSNYFSVTKKFDTIRYLYDRRYVPLSKSKDTIINSLRQAGLVDRGWNYFINNITKILITLFKISRWKTKPNDDGRKLELYLIRMGLLPNPLTGVIGENKVFTDWLAFPSSTISFQEKTPLGNYVRQDPMASLISSIEAAIGIDYKSEYHQELAVAKIMSQQVKIHETIIRDQINGKLNLMRHSVMGIRAKNSGRGVITAIQGPHMVDEIHMPWTMILPIIEPQLHAVMGRDGYTPNDIRMMIRTTVNAPEEESHEFMVRKDILTHYVKIITENIQKSLDPNDWESPIIPHKPRLGFPVLMGRNPSLTITSILSFLAIPNTWDIRNKCIAIPVQCVASALNADFDGDHTWIVFTFTNKAIKDSRNLAVWTSATQVSKMPGTMNLIDHDKCITLQTAVMMQNGMKQTRASPEGLF